MTREELENEVIDMLRAAGSNVFDAPRRRRTLNRKAKLISMKLSRIGGVNFSRGVVTLTFAGASALIDVADFMAARTLRLASTPTIATQACSGVAGYFARIVHEDARRDLEFESGYDVDDRPVGFVRYDASIGKSYFEFLAAQSGDWELVYERICPTLDLADSGNSAMYTTIPSQFDVLIAYDTTIELLGGNTENEAAAPYIAEATRLHDEIERMIGRVSAR